MASEEFTDGAERSGSRDERIFDERPPLSDFDLSKIGEPADGILYLYRSAVDGFWYVDSDENMALQEATGYPVGELQDHETAGDFEDAESGDLLAIFIYDEKWRDNRTLDSDADQPGGDSA